MSKMTYSRAERLYFKVFGRWPERVVSRRLADTHFDPTNVNTILRNAWGVETDAELYAAMAAADAKRKLKGA